MIKYEFIKNANLRYAKNISLINFRSSITEIIILKWSVGNINNNKLTDDYVDCFIYILNIL